MAHIQSGVDATLQVVDPNSKAARVILYDAAGNPVLLFPGEVKSGADATLLTVDPISLAARVTLYGPDGQALAVKSNYGKGIYQAKWRHTSAIGATNPVFALRNTHATRVVYIRKAWFQLWFDGVGAATEMAFAWRRGTGCTSIATGSVVTPFDKRSSLATSDIECKVLDTSLNCVGVTWGSYFTAHAWARLTHSATQAGGVSPLYLFDFGDQPVELMQNEVLAVVTAGNTVIGDNVSGGVEYAVGL